MLNYEYWIIGDRRWLLSRKRTANVSDVVTRWRNALIRSHPDYENDPAAEIVKEAMQHYETVPERQDRQRLVQSTISDWLNQMTRNVPGYDESRDALHFDPTWHPLPASDEEEGGQTLGTIALNLAGLGGHGLPWL
ncbi:hypothetical protein OG21DRAFT_1526821 [Imleria badia]|nr:hypothetical protein OG21DRAFT_1526821 [Imleria badia]